MPRQIQLIRGSLFGCWVIDVDTCIKMISRLRGSSPADALLFMDIAAGASDVMGATYLELFVNKGIPAFR